MRCAAACGEYREVAGLAYKDDLTAKQVPGKSPSRSICDLEKAADWSLNFQADHPAFIFQVVGQSRDDVPTVVQAGGCHPGSQLQPCIGNDLQPDVLWRRTQIFAFQTCAEVFTRKSECASGEARGGGRLGGLKRAFYLHRTSIPLIFSPHKADLIKSALSQSW
jgi:hypothetical protein